MFDQPPIVVVSTGRCGSTLLSQLLREHDDVLSLSEFWPNRLNLPELFSATPQSGSDYWRLLSVPMAEDIYRIALGGRISQVPKRTLHERNYMRRIALPSLVDDYDSLFGEIEQFVVARGVATPAEHVKAMFGFIAQRLGKRVWVERTGASIEYLPAWRTMWPDMHVVHMYRDGRDVALSMSKHHAFRLMIMRREANPHSSWLHIRPLPATELDIEAFYARQIPLPAFGELWNRMVCEGLEQLRGIPEHQQHWLRYEDLQSAPEQTLTRLLAFIDPRLSAGPWAKRCAEKLHPGRNDWRALEPGVLAELHAACRDGLRLLGYDEEPS
jgi:hypothetical protein